jgi:hypothetical protein
MAETTIDAEVGIVSPMIDAGPRRLYDVVGETSAGKRQLHCVDDWVTDAFALWDRVQPLFPRLAVDAPNGTYKVVASGLQLTEAREFNVENLLGLAGRAGDLIPLRWVGTSYRVSGNKARDLLDDADAVPMDRWERPGGGDPVITPARYRFVLMNHRLGSTERTVWTAGPKKVVVVREGERISGLVMPRRATEPMCHYMAEDI